MPQLLQPGLTVEWLRACSAVLVWKHRRPRRRLVCLLCAAVLQYAVRSLSRNTDEIAADRNVLEKSMLLTTDSPILCVAAGSVCRCTEAGPTYSIVAVEAFCSFSLRIILMLTILLAHKITTKNSLSPLYLLTNNDEVDQHSLFAPVCFLPPHEFRYDGRRARTTTTTTVDRKQHQVGKRPP